MSKQNEIKAAKEFAKYNADAKAFFVTTDLEVFVDANDAVANAVKLDSGNPTVTEVSLDEVKNFKEDASGLKAISKKEAVEKATKQVEKMELAEKTAKEALDKAKPNTKAKLTEALEKATANVASAKEALTKANEMTEDNQGE